MNETGEWICKLTSLGSFTRGEERDLSATVAELDRIRAEQGVEYAAIQFDLQQLIECY